MGEPDTRSRKALMDPQMRSDNIPCPDPLDGDLVTRSVEGDRMAFEAIYRRHVDRVYGTCLRLTTDCREAEGLTQDTFVRAWFALAGFSGQGSLVGWLASVAVNLWRDRIRQDKRRDRLGEQIAREASMAGELPSGQGHRNGVIPLLTAMDLERAVAQLPPGASVPGRITTADSHGHGRDPLPDWAP